MTQCFDTYTKHSARYKLTEISALIFVLLLIPILILQNKLNTVLSSFWNTILLSAFVLSLIGFLVGLLMWTIRSNILMYLKDGELELGYENFKLDTKTYNLNTINKVEFIVIGYRGQSGSRGGKDGTGNKIKVYEKLNEIVEKRFVINTEEQLKNLKDILIHWRQTGFNVKVVGFDLE